MSFRNDESSRIDKLGLSQNVRTDARLQSGFGHEVYSSPEQILKFLIQRGELDQPNPGARLEINQQVDVAFGLHIPTGSRAENGELLHIITPAHVRYGWEFD